MKSLGFIPALFLVIFSSCTREDDPQPEPQPNSVSIQLYHRIDGQSLLFDTMLYATGAGHRYGITGLTYYLSSVQLTRSTGDPVKLKDFWYCDAASPGTQLFKVVSVPKGSYTGIQFNIGLDSALNQTGALPATTENLNMEWPVPMGGGYHFMKFEGHYGDSLWGFAMHLGTNNCLVRCQLLHPFTVGDGDLEIGLEMNLNEWFRNPEIYDFDLDGNYSMGNMAAMQKLTLNGSDVFTIQ
ncbi:MAG: hypothetical protein IT242_03730 [Bacteroidia bacterium]|nr:hypothetical protein [Bacteroidia bacterium]